MADDRARQLSELIAPLRVPPGSRVTLAKDYDPAFKAGWLKKKEGEQHQQRSAQQEQQGEFRRGRPGDAEPCGHIPD